MRVKSWCGLGVSLVLSFVLTIPAELPAAGQSTNQRAGEISRVIPAANISRGPKTLNASTKTQVDWLDKVNTQAGGRARVGLDDGSVLNVGSDSSMVVTKHDAAVQQTDLELTYGKLRTQAQKIAKPDGKFEVRTPAGVAGVVGTDFYVDYSNNLMNVIVFEGQVKVCNLAGACVVAKAGQTTNVRTNDNSPPPAPVQATLAMLTNAATDTDNGGSLGAVAQNIHHIGKGTAIMIGVLAVIPAVVVPVVVIHSRGKQIPPPECIPGESTGNCG
jgi:hypothetical protein